MTVAVLGILVALWLAVVAPPALRYLTGERRRADSVDDFNDALTVLGRTNGHHTPAPETAPTMTAAQRRRRDVLVGLTGAVGASLVLALLLGGRPFWGLFLLTASLLAGYVYLLVQHRQRALERRAKVRYLPTPAVRNAQYAPARVASGR